MNRMIKSGTYCARPSMSVFTWQRAVPQPVLQSGGNARPGTKAFGLAVRKGVKIAFGTDAAIPWTEMRRKSSVLWSGME